MQEATRLGVISLAFLAACALYWSGVGENDALYLPPAERVAIW